MRIAIMTSVPELSSREVKYNGEYMDTSALESLSIIDLLSAVIEIFTTTMSGQVILGLILGSFIARLVSSWLRIL